MDNKVTILSLNCENLFLQNNTSLYQHNKPSEKLKLLADSFNYYKPHILLISEIGGIESLHNFNTKYLENAYQEFYHQGNSDRNIGLGALVNRTFPFKVQTFSHDNQKINDQDQPPNYLTRDILELRVQSQTEKERPLFTLFFVHLKSQWDRTGEDFRGFQQRQQEVHYLCKVVNQHNKNYPNTPAIGLGDFNGNASLEAREKEFLPIHENLDKKWYHLFDILDWPDNDRYTALHFNHRKKLINEPIDFIFIPKDLISKIDKNKSGRGNFVKKSGLPFPRPYSPQQRALFPSDHLPLLLTFEIPQGE